MVAVWRSLECDARQLHITLECPQQHLELVGTPTIMGAFPAIQLLHQGQRKEQGRALPVAGFVNGAVEG